MEKKHVRFWVWINDGPVKIALKVGDRVHWGRGGRTEEGWSSEGVQWERDENGVTRATTHDRTDCDGRLTQHWDDRMKEAAYVPAGEFDNEGRLICYPLWEDIGSSQRDYTAEAANY